MKQLACALIAFCACMGILLIAVADVNHGHGPGHHVEGHDEHHDGHHEETHGDSHEHGAEEHHAENLHGFLISFPVKNGIV